MLKLTYTENGFQLERLPDSVEKWVTTRVLLALRSGTRLGVEPSTASFLLPGNIPYLAELETLIDGENSPAVVLAGPDAEAIEVCLQGTWLVFGEESEEGIFVCGLSDRVESFLDRVWKESEFGAYVVNE
ncbi:alr0857 family protein [Pannus brasiliensis CCIBt3594]|uniref:Alr0857 family protein n=2 Tax=Pannus TaxID=1427526 RepID=A0AAW9QLF7_9CHRO